MLFDIVNHQNSSYIFINILVYILPETIKISNFLLYSVPGKLSIIRMAFRRNLEMHL